MFLYQLLKKGKVVSHLIIGSSQVFKPRQSGVVYALGWLDVTTRLGMFVPVPGIFWLQSQSEFWFKSHYQLWMFSRSSVGKIGYPGGRAPKNTAPTRRRLEQYQIEEKKTWRKYIYRSYTIVLTSSSFPNSPNLSMSVREVCARPSQDVISYKPVHGKK